MSDDIASLARAKFGEPNRLLSTQKQLRFGRHGSINVCLHGEKSGAWYDFESTKGGWLSHDDHDDHRALNTRKSLMAFDGRSEPQFERIVPNELVRVEEAFTRAPGRNRPIVRAPAHEYLISRGIDHWPDHSVYGWSGLGICYLARGPSGPCAVQVLPLTPDGKKSRTYWPDGVTKRTYARMSGWHYCAAVWMPGKRPTVLCEGVETGLSIWLATGFTVAACLGLAGILHLKTSKTVIIARDGDAPDSPADKTIRNAISERTRIGQKVRVATPPQSMDWNDVHQQCGINAVRDMIKDAR